MALVVAGCSETHQYANPCQDDSTFVDTGTARYCVAVVVRGGFECPAELPFKLEIGEGAVCAAGPIEIDELPDVICIEFEECISTDGGMKDAGRDSAMDAEVPIDTCALEEVTFSYADIASSGSGCPEFSPEMLHVGNATLIGARSTANELGHVLDIDLDYCPNANDDCRCRLSFAGGFSQAAAIMESARQLQATMGLPVLVALRTPDANGSWNVQMMNATTERETLVFSAARSVDTKPNLQGPSVLGGQLSVIWEGDDKVCATGDAGYSVPDEGTIVLPDSVLGTVPLGGFSDVDGEGGDRFRVYFTEGRHFSMSYTTSAFFLPGPIATSCNLPAVASGECGSVPDGEAVGCSNQEICFAPGQPNIGVCRDFMDCNTEAFKCGATEVCETYDDPSACSGTGYRCVPDCRTDPENNCGEWVCNTETGVCEPPNCNEVAGVCDRFHACQSDGSCERISCVDTECDCGYCVNGGCYEQPGQCSMPAP